jgi:hypothetical protein
MHIYITLMNFYALLYCFVLWNVLMSYKLHSLLQLQCSRKEQM